MDATPLVVGLIVVIVQRKPIARTLREVWREANPR